MPPKRPHYHWSRRGPALFSTRQKNNGSEDIHPGTSAARAADPVLAPASGPARGTQDAGTARWPSPRPLRQRGAGRNRWSEPATSRMERGGAGGAWWEQVHTSGPDQGCQIKAPHLATTGARPGAGKAGPRRERRWQASCSPGEGRVAGIAHSVAGRARKGVGRKPQYSTVRLGSTIGPDPSRALHARLWAVNVRGPDIGRPSSWACQ